VVFRLSDLWSGDPEFAGSGARIGLQAMPGGVPAWQPWAGLAGVLIWTLIATFAAARIFTVGILMQGQTPKLPEIFRWALRG
jgi:hypothetical protein